MKKPYSLFAAITLAAAMPAAWAQQPAQQFQYPAAPGSYSPPSTLRISESPIPGSGQPVRDTPESLRTYEQCRIVSDRAAVSREQMRQGAEQCLRELEARRQQGQ
ncbi:hypothetical protein [Bordetella sp. 2513F-2]